MYFREHLETYTFMRRIAPPMFKKNRSDGAVWDGDIIMDKPGNWGLLGTGSSSDRVKLNATRRYPV